MQTGAFMEKQVKILQYLMLIVLFSVAFLLPAFAVGRQVRESMGQQVEEESGESDHDSRQGEKGTIVIDAGHGGDDPGMVGSSGISEKILNLVYAQKLGALLEQEGYRVVQTRTDEGGLYDADQTHKKAQDMQRRCAIIAEEKPLLTVSIHQNSYPDASVCGPQVFYYEQSAEGKLLASSIQNCLNEELAIDRPRLQKGNGTYYILKRSAGTTVIVECGFLSNPEEEAKLQEEAYQDQVVLAVFHGVVRYLEGKKSGPGPSDTEPRAGSVLYSKTGLFTA